MATTETGAPVAQTTNTTAQIVDTALFSIVATTSSTPVTAGSTQTITVASATNIVQNMWLTIDTGTPTETVKVTSISGTSVTALFTNAHTGTYIVTANVNRQITSLGSPSTQTQIAEVDAQSRLTIISSRPTQTVTTTVNASATSATLVAARPARLALVVFNHSATINAYIAENITASIAAGGYTYLLPPQATLELSTDVYTGAYAYISDSADGSYLNVTERY